MLCSCTVTYMKEKRRKVPGDPRDCGDFHSLAENSAEKLQKRLMLMLRLLLSH